MSRKGWIVGGAALALSLLVAAPALACGGLVAPNGTINLLRTTTMSAYKDGVQHYVTSFEFAGGGGEFGSIVPLPGVPSDVIKGGDWTLQRLLREVQPVVLEAVAADASRNSLSAKVLLEKKIEALDITVLEGGGDAVGNWARDHGFNLPPDAPEVLDFYAARSPIFLAAVFDASRARARGQEIGDGTPVHVVIPTPNPWVPLRILGLGRQSNELIEADLFLLNERRPALLPAPGSSIAAPGFALRRSEPASAGLLADLRSDRGMKWLPTEDMWLTYLSIEAKAGDLVHDLAIDASGAGRPSAVQAGLRLPDLPSLNEDFVLWPWLLAVALGGAVLFSADRLVVTRQ